MTMNIKIGLQILDGQELLNVPMAGNLWANSLITAEN
jgi:hypothetical protein